MELSVKLNRKFVLLPSRSRQPEVFAAMYKMHAPGIYNSVYRILNCGALAEDIVQDAFCTAWEQWHKLRETDRFGGWVRQIAIHLSINHLRKNNERFQILDTNDSHSDTTYDAEEEQAALTRVAEVKAAIAALPAGYRTIVVLHLFEEIPQEEIAGMLNISHTTVRTQYHRAKKKIISMLKNKSHEAG